jgi:LPS-assembly lipoprotein
MPLRPLLLLAPLLLAACGFHLQGPTQLPRSLASARLDARDQQSDFYAALRAALLVSGARLDAPAADAATIHILSDEVSEQVLTVSATRNIPTAFRLNYRVRVSVDYQGRELLVPELYTVAREYSFDERALLAKQREREVLQQALADDLAALVMRRLAAL